jgi:hypothetical protein
LSQHDEIKEDVWNVVKLLTDSLVLDSGTLDLEHVDVEYSSNAFVLKTNKSSAVAFRHGPGFASPEDCVDCCSDEDVSLGFEGDVLSSIELDHHGDLGGPLVDLGADFDVFVYLL